MILIIIAMTEPIWFDLIRVDLMIVGYAPAARRIAEHNNTIMFGWCNGCLFVAEQPNTEITMTHLTSDNLINANYMTPSSSSTTNHSQ